MRLKEILKICIAFVLFVIAKSHYSDCNTTCIGCSTQESLINLMCIGLYMLTLVILVNVASYLIKERKDIAERKE